MDYTQHYNLKKPAYGEAVDVKDINDNADITDAQLNTLAGLVAARLLKTDLVNQIINNATKAASAATVYSVNKRVDDVNSDLGNLKNAVGADYWSSVESINISANNWATGTKKITLPPGRYIVIAHAEFPPGENVGTLSVAGSSIVERQQSFYGSMLIRRITTTFFEIVTSQKELNVTLWSNTAMTAQDCEIMAIRIK